MPGKKTIQEDEFLSVVTCPRFLSLNYNPYQLDRSQSIALYSLKYFYQNINKLYQGLDIDNLINSSVVRAIGSKLKNELDAYKKSIKLYCYTFVYDFIKKFPLEDWSPILVDMKVPFENSTHYIYFNYDFILKNKKTQELSVINFIHKMDRQIEGNLHYFQCKAAFIQDKIYLPLGKPKINHYCFYLPRYKHSALKKRDTFLFLPLVIEDKNNIIFYINIFINKLALERNPFCLNYSCKVRKYCYDNN
jgi:hypothetical protein